jgi:hypothetical protein
LIGWVAAFIWACSADRPRPVHYVPVSAGPFCCRCGSPAHTGAHFSGACGRTI